MIELHLPLLCWVLLWLFWELWAQKSNAEIVKTSQVPLHPLLGKGVRLR